ncbi:polyprenyl synthetase family protein [Reinekea marinisedimentorum]|uniref:Octaprenyl diphosphate synthase n=1 Tax=Reinekea marinisedimentorum TaxID=230495 RepID=A0A4R3HZ41_9GAMM|nr:polyprenyl synthetase family protein [Reinekea marinisedimentorum]TCS37601.1 octaprenyl-diphosphate synthase [Reinekea marinisedimentorum]
MDSKAVFQTVSDDFDTVNNIIYQQLASHVPMVEKVAEYIISSGGKRMRPTLVLLTAGMNGQTSETHCELATVIEFLHTATLLHDDVVDTSDMRRGRQTANAKWGNAPSVLVGDFLYARSFELLVKIANLEVMNSLASTTRKIAEGEVLQLMNVKNPNTTEAQYMDVITGKTAILFEASAKTSGIISGCSAEQIEALAAYGLNLGLAFQLIDDVLDYSGDAEALGKNVGDDLAEGKPTLPLIHAMEHGSDDDAKLIRSCIRKGSLDQLEAVQAILKNNESIEYVEALAQKHAQIAKDALQGFADNKYKEALLSLADIAVERRS